MPVIKCKEKEGQAEACKKDIVYTGEEITSLLGGNDAIAKKSKSEATEGGKPATSKKRYLTLKCVDGHLHNYEIAN